MAEERALLAEHLLQFSLKGRNIWLLEADGGNDFFAARGKSVLVAPQFMGHARDGLLAEFVGLLHNRPVNIARRHARQRLGVLVKTNNLHRARLARAFDRVKNRRAVIAPQSV